jgi:hypothetical protein
MKLVLFGAVASFVVINAQEQVQGRRQEVQGGRESASGEVERTAEQMQDQLDELANNAANDGSTEDDEGPELGSMCQNGDLIISIPHPDEKTASLLFLDAGTCDQDNFQGSITYDHDTQRAEVSIPIDHCNLREELYGTPITTRKSSIGLYTPTANITLGSTLEGGLEIIFKSIMVAAECGTRTTYGVSFEYNVTTADQSSDCQKIDGHCVFPSYEDNIQLEITEFTNDTFLEEVNADNRQNIAGEIIYLSMRAIELRDSYTFAVTECSVITDDDTRIILMTPGVNVTEVGNEDLVQTCGLDAIGLHGGYNGQNFNFQHVLFHLNGADEHGMSSFRLDCTAEICDRDDLNSKCRMAKLPCRGSSLHTNIPEAADRDPNASTN